MSTQQHLTDFGDGQQVPAEWQDLTAAQLLNRGLVEDGERAREIAHGGQQ
jgi:hypothetical protein